MKIKHGKFFAIPCDATVKRKYSSAVCGYTVSLISVQSRQRKKYHTK